MQDSCKSTLLAAIRDFDKTKIEVVTGLVGAGTRTEIVSAAVLPQINGVLLVHQAEASTQQAVSRILTPLGYVGLVIGLAMIIITTKVGVAIIKRYENELAIINEGLEQTVRDRTRALTKTRDAVIFGLAKLAESRDSDTGEHLERISLFSTELAATVERRAGNSHSPLVDSIGLASSLHDIGKVGVPDRVLLKPGRLEAEERKIIEIHPKVGEDCLNAIEERLGNDGFLSLAKEICAYHHEKWDGSGYPYQLAGSQIPISARIVAVADVYDALRSRRPYKDPMTHEAARQIILQGSGKHFDPDIVDSFLECESAFERISSNYLAANLVSPSVITTPLLVSMASATPSVIQTSVCNVCHATP
jgi:response regulator RpfG family c-di-GMP phosphodiesterase